MRFYPETRLFRLLFTCVTMGTILAGLWRLRAHPHWSMGIVYAIFLGGAQTYSLWTRYWEIREDGTLQGRGFGTRLTYQLADLRYAGPVRGPVSFPMSAKKDLELDFGRGSVRYARISEKASFLEALQRVAPQAKVVPLWLIDDESRTVDGVAQG